MRPGRAPALRLFGVVPARIAEAVPLPPGIHLVGFRELAATVTDQPAGRRPPPTPPDVAEHCAVVAGIFAHSTIVPSPPGVVFRTRDALLGWLEVHHAALSDAIAHLDGRGEARVYLRRARAAAQENGPQAGRLAAAEASALDAEAHELFENLGRDLPAWITSAHAVPNRSGAVAVLAAGDGDERSPTAAGREPAAALATPDGSRDVLEASASFLVDRSRWRAFLDRVAAEVQRDPALTVELTGPWPPYDFVRMEFGG